MAGTEIKRNATIVSSIPISPADVTPAVVYASIPPSILPASIAKHTATPVPVPVPLQKVTPVVETAKSVKPIKSVEPAKSVESARPGEYAKSVGPFKPVESARPVESVKPLESAKPMKSARPGEYAKSVGPFKPVESARPVESVKPVVSVRPGEYAKSVKPVASGEPAIIATIKISDAIAISRGGSTKTSVKTFDGLATLSYFGATATQLTLIISCLHILQFKVLPAVQSTVAAHSQLPTTLPTALVTLFFAFLSLRSRIFSPLDNSRPSANKEDPVFKDRRRPWWQPPPLAFPIIWSTISILRTFSSVLVWRKTGTLLCTPIFAFLLHLCIGDTWNTINNVEKRLGTSVLGVFFVLASVYNATYLYFKTLPVAGKILAPSSVWLTIATFLIYSIWRLNSQMFDRPSLLPSKEEGPACSWRLPLFKTKINK
jgi:benzodiazapine receptor